MMQNIKKTVKIAGLYALVIAMIGSISLPAYAIPDGQNDRVVYSEFSFNEESAVMPLMSVSRTGDDKKVALSSDTHGTLAARYSADGRKVTYTAASFNANNPRVFVSDSGGENAVVLAESSADLFPERDQYSVGFSDLNLDATKVAWGEFWYEQIDPDNSELGRQKHCPIYMANVDGSGKQLLLDDADRCSVYPVFSPDGTKIAFVGSDNEAGEDGRINGIYTMNTDGSDVQTVHTFEGRSDEIRDLLRLLSDDLSFDGKIGGTIDWSPDGTAIMFTDKQMTDNEAGTLVTPRIVEVTLQGQERVIYDNPQQADELGYPLSGMFTVVGQAQYAANGQIIFRETDIVISPGDDEDSDEYQSIQSRLRFIYPDGTGLVTVTEGEAFQGEVSGYGLYNLTTPTMQPVANESEPDALTASLQNIENGKPVVFASSACGSINSISADKESELGAQDSKLDYPSSMVSYELGGCGNGESTTVTLIFQGLEEPTQSYQARKYNPSTKVYGDISGATIESTTLNGEPAVQLTYSITDGGELDMDGVANGTIVDPVGLGVSVQGASDGTTGGGDDAGGLAATGQRVLLIPAVVLGLTSVLLTYERRRRAAHYTKQS